MHRLSTGRNGGHNTPFRLVGVDPAFENPPRGHTELVDDVAFSPRGDTLASCGYDGTVRLWHVPTLQQLAVLHRDAGSADFTGLAFSADGSVLAAVRATGAAHIRLHPKENSILVWRTAARTED